MIYSILQIKAFNNNYTIRILKCQQKTTLFFVFICGFICVFMWFLLFFTYFLFCFLFSLLTEFHPSVILKLSKAYRQMAISPCKKVSYSVIFL